MNLLRIHPEAEAMDNSVVDIPRAQEGTKWTKSTEELSPIREMRCF